MDYRFTTRTCTGMVACVCSGDPCLCGVRSTYAGPVPHRVLLGTHCVDESSTSPRSNLACVAREDSAGIEQPRLKPQSRAQPDLSYTIEFSLEISLNFVSTCFQKSCSIAGQKMGQQDPLIHDKCADPGRNKFTNRKGPGIGGEIWR